jgi:hypothetical protein
MRRLKIVISVFVLLCLFGFNDEKKSLMIQQKVPADFNFTIDSGGNDSYNSEYKSFYRKYLNEDKTVKVELTKGEKEKIYSFIVKSNFFKMPVKFQPKAGIIIVKNPSFTESIVVYVNGKRKYVSYDNGETNDLNDKKAKPFLDLYEMIWDVLYKKKEIIELPKSDYYYE